MNFTKPWLCLPAKVAHNLSGVYLRAYGATHSIHIENWSPLTWRGLYFQNPLGIAGGVDKNADLLSAWWALGCGFVEVGTVTPTAQKPNPGFIMDRDSHPMAVWNRMGFPNKGSQHVLKRLIRGTRPGPVFVNIGKNRHTPLEKAFEDYVFCLKSFESVADVFVVNISSPNTSGLRELLQPKNLRIFLQPIVQANEKKKPILLKLSPDISDDELKSILDTTSQLDGWIISNTTLARTADLNFPVEGGVSGKPLAEQSKKLLSVAVKHLGSDKKDKLLVSVGGVMTAEDVKERLQMGANLVQVYAALVFHGPKFFRQVATAVRKTAEARA